jgi:hypothetical protein
MPGTPLFTLVVLSGLALPAPAPMLAPQDAEERDVRTLVEQLDSEDISQRDRARQSLIAKGPKIIPILKPFLKSSSAEVAGEVRAILDRFERESRLEQSLPALRTVTLPRGRHTPEDVFREIQKQTGYRIDAYGLKMREPLEIGWEKVPVLRVLDDVCRLLGQGRPEPPALRARTTDDFDFDFERPPDTAENGIRIDGDFKPPRAAAHWNQFRAVVDDVAVTETRSLKTSFTEAHLTLSLSAQPGTHPIDVGSWEVEEILDDQGGALQEGGIRQGRMMRREADPEVGESLDSVWFTLNRHGRFEKFPMPIPIKPPSPEIRRIARLKLKLRVSFAVEERTRTVKIKDIEDKGMDVADFGEAGIRFSKPEFKDKSFHLHYVVVGTPHGEPALVLLNQEGAELRSRGGGSSSSGAEHDRHWYLSGTNEVTAIRVSAWIGRKTIEIPFEFTDIPLPGDR